MKTLSAPILLLSFFLFSCGGGSDQDNVDGNAAGGQEIPQDSPPLIKDANLTEAIRKALNKPEGELTKQDLESLESLQVGRSFKLGQGKGISELSGLGHAVNLTTFGGSNNKIEDCSDVRNLKKLEILGISWNRIHDLSSVSTLTNLKDLDFGVNQVKNLDPLSDLSALEILNAGRNPITDISPLARCGKLTKIDLHRTEVEDLSPLSKLSDLQEISLDGSPVRSLKPLSNLFELKVLKASGSRLSDLTPLKELTKLEYLYLDNNKISVLEPLNGLNALKELHLKGNPITIDQLESLQKALPKCVIRFSEIITRLGNDQVDVTNEKKKTLYQMEENQLKNASFENDRQDWVLKIYRRTRESTVIAIDDKEFKDGQKSYKLEIKEHEDSGAMKGYQAIVKQRSITVNPGCRHLVSGYIKTQDLLNRRGGSGRAYIGGYHGYSGANLTATSHDWKYVQSLTKVIDLNQTSFSFGIGFTNANVTGAAWFDDLSLNLLTVLKHSVRVSAKIERGVPTGIMVKTGEKYRFDASGKWAWGIAGRGEASDANGTLGRPHKKELPVVVEGGLFGQLAGLVGDQKFLIGMANEITMEADGELLLLMNDRAGSYGDNSGSMNVTIKQVIP